MRFTFTRGLPGSGKSTWALKQTLANPREVARVNMDLLREMFQGSSEPVAGTRICEERVVLARNSTIELLMQVGVPHIISDDTNFDSRDPVLFADLASRHGYELVVKDFTHVPLEECIRRDRQRPRQVGEEVIRAMAARYLGRSSSVSNEASR